MKERNVKIFKLITFAIFILVMVLLAIWLFPIFKSISTEEGRINFANEIEGLGSKGAFAIIRPYDNTNISSNTSTESQLKYLLACRMEYLAVLLYYL